LNLTFALVALELTRVVYGKSTSVIEKAALAAKKRKRLTWERRWSLQN
jgi:hypothetical protein